MPRRQRNRATRRRPRPLGGLLGDQRVEAVAAREQRPRDGRGTRRTPPRTSGSSKRSAAQPRQMALESRSRPGRRRSARGAAAACRCDAGGHQIAAQILAARTRSRSASSSGSGTSTARSCPAACNRASFSASRVSVLIRSPGWRGIAPGRADHHLDPRRPRRPGQPEPGRPGLIDRPHRPGQRLQPLDRRARRADELRLEHLSRPELHRRRRRLARMHVQGPRNRYRPSRRRSSSIDAVTSPRHTMRGSVDALSSTGGGNAAHTV